MKLRTLLRVLLVLVLMIIAGISAFRASVDDSLTDLRNSTTQRLEMYANSLDSEIGHYARLPSLLALSPYVDRLLREPGNEQERQAANDGPFGRIGRDEQAADSVVCETHVGVAPDEPFGWLLKEVGGHFVTGFDKPAGRDTLGDDMRCRAGPADLEHHHPSKRETERCGHFTRMDVGERRRMLPRFAARTVTATHRVRTDRFSPGVPVACSTSDSNAHW